MYGQNELKQIGRAKDAVRATWRQRGVAFEAACDYTHFSFVASKTAFRGKLLSES